MDGWIDQETFFTCSVFSVQQYLPCVCCCLFLGAFSIFFPWLSKSWDSAQRAYFSEGAFLASLGVGESWSCFFPKSSCEGWKEPWTKNLGTWVFISVLLLALRVTLNNPLLLCASTCHLLRGWGAVMMFTLFLSICLFFKNIWFTVPVSGEPLVSKRQGLHYNESHNLTWERH